MRYLKNYELKNMGKQNKSYQQTDKEAFETQIREVYDNLVKEDFESLLKAVAIKFANLKQDGKLNLVKDKSGEKKYYFENSFDETAFKVFLTVKESRRLSFKQFKLLSAFAKVNWLQEEYKQF